MRWWLTAGLRSVRRQRIPRIRKMKVHETFLKVQVNTMATSSILGGSKLPEEVSGKDMHALGPSDNSDSGSDVTGAYGDEQLSSDSDSYGTGERSEVGFDSGKTGADILPDHIETDGADSGDGQQALLDLDDIENITDDTQDPQDPQDPQDGENSDSDELA